MIRVLRPQQITIGPQTDRLKHNLNIRNLRLAIKKEKIIAFSTVETLPKLDE